MLYPREHSERSVCRRRARGTGRSRRWVGEEGEREHRCNRAVRQRSWASEPTNKTNREGVGTASSGRRRLCPLLAKGLGAMLFSLTPLPQRNGASICPQGLRTHSTAPVQPKAETRS